MEAEVTGKLLRSGIRPYEVPITYKARSREDGKKLTWKDGVEAIWILARERCPQAGALTWKQSSRRRHRADRRCRDRSRSPLERQCAGSLTADAGPSRSVVDRHLLDWRPCCWPRPPLPSTTSRLRVLRAVLE